MKSHVIWALLLFVFCLPTSLNAVIIVESGKAKSEIVICQTDSKQLLSAAETLREYIEKSTGARLRIIPMLADRSSEGQAFGRIFLCAKACGSYQTSDLGNIGEDGFLISVRDSGDIYIAGMTDWGASFGVYAFLEKVLGVRWLLPGPDGEHVPIHQNLRVPVQEIRETPAFFQRNIGGLRGGEQGTWGYRNGLHRTASYAHNLFRLFPPEQYTVTHPEFFPLIGGKRYSPPSGGKQGWQPCFSAKGIVEEGVRNIGEYFTKNSDQAFYSIGLNHGSLWCECNACTSKDTGKTNYMGFRNMSDRYFEWANKVAEGVSKHYPDKWLGCLAHKELAEPPRKTRVHPIIAPFITYDRMKWVDPELEERGKRITEEWARKSYNLGWYDYIYGTPYCLPRVYFHKMAEYYQYARANGVRYMAAEAFPNWGEGPKYYLALKLQWNPYQDVDALLRDWYVAAVGSKGANDLAAYFGLWEHFWTERVLQGKWFTKDGAYLAFKNPSYLELVSYDDISTSRKLLESVVARAETSKQRARAKLLLRAFEYYEASAISFLGLERNMVWHGRSKEYFENMNQRRLDLVKEFQNNPVLIHPIRFDSPGYERLRWGATGDLRPAKQPK